MIQPGGYASDVLDGPNGIILDRRSRTVVVAGTEVSLTKQGFDLLALLLENRGDVLSKEYLAQTVWHHDAVSDLHFLHTAVYRVRAALRAAGGESPIVAVRGVGYTIPGARNGAGVFRVRDAFEEVIRASVVPTMMIDTSRRIRFANAAFAELVGYTIEELEALPNSAVLSPGDRQGARTQLLARIFGGESNRAERVPLKRRDGSLVYVPMLSLRPITIDGDVVGAIFECVTSDLYHGDHVATPSSLGQPAQDA